MGRELPIACTLSAAALSERLGEVSALGREALVSVGEGELRFRAGPGVRERLAAIVAAEAECCSFLAFELSERNGEHLVRVSGPPEAEPVVRELIAAFANG